jgi:hypothetical protein
MKSELRNCSRLLLVLQHTLDSLQNECGAILLIDLTERIETNRAMRARTVLLSGKLHFLPKAFLLGSRGKSIRNVAPSVWRFSEKSNYFF